jgi:hypothetical protein
VRYRCRVRAAAVAVGLVLLGACASPAASSGAGDVADLAGLAARDAAPGDLATADLSPSVCGNGDCEPGESGAACASDCCDAATACDATRGNGGAFFCRSMNGGAFAWYTQADATDLCSQPSQLGVTTWACAARSGTCCSLPGGYVDGACP